jgi:SAM-dependent methyltransferase
MAARVAAHKPADVLEIAAGTGVVTRALASALAPDARITATDLNQPMLDQAAAIGTARPVRWQQADAMQLPFENATFDVLACQFGVMFFPDKAKAFSEARRVLRPGGVFIFNVWDALEHNEFAHAVTDALERVFPEDPPRFMARVPHGYYDAAVITRDLAAGGFAHTPAFTTVAQTSRASSPQIPATALCQGTPLRAEIEARGATRLQEATEEAAAEIARRFGGGEITGKIQAHIVSVRR